MFEEGLGPRRCSMNCEEECLRFLGVLHSGPWQFLDVFENVHVVVVVVPVALDRSQGPLKTVGPQKDVWVLGDSVS